MMRRVADAIIAATDCWIVVEIEHREGLLPLVLSGVGAAVLADSWRPLADAVGLQVRRLALEDQLDVALVWQRHRLSPAAAAFVAVAEKIGRRLQPLTDNEHLLITLQRRLGRAEAARDRRVPRRSADKRQMFK